MNVLKCSLAYLKPRVVRRRVICLVILLSLCSISCTTTHHTQPAVEPPSKPDNEQARIKRNIGEAYIMQGNYTAALKELLEAERMNPKDAITHNYLGIAYKNKKLLDKAIRHFKKALDLNPGYSVAKNNLGTAYLDEQNWDAAIICFNEVLSDILYVTPHFPLANLGWAFYNKQEYTKAISYYKKALQAMPNFIIALNGLGQTYMAEKKYHEAAETFEKLVKLQNRVPLFYLELAKAYGMTNQEEKSSKAYLKVIELAPESEMAEEAKRKINK